MQMTESELIQHLFRLGLRGEIPKIEVLAVCWQSHLVQNDRADEAAALSQLLRDSDDNPTVLRSVGDMLTTLLSYQKEDALLNLSADSLPTASGADVDVPIIVPLATSSLAELIDAAEPMGAEEISPDEGVTLPAPFYSRSLRRCLIRPLALDERFNEEGDDDEESHEEEQSGNQEENAVPGEMRSVEPATRSGLTQSEHVSAMAQSANDSLKGLLIALGDEGQQSRLMYWVKTYFGLQSCAVFRHLSPVKDLFPTKAAGSVSKKAGKFHREVTAHQLGAGAALFEQFYIGAFDAREQFRGAAVARILERGNSWHPAHMKDNVLREASEADFEEMRVVIRLANASLRAFGEDTGL
jgi:hypothetical protein